MKKTNLHKILSAILTFSLLFGIVLPTNAVISAIAAEQLIDYSITDFSKLEGDGWISTYYNGTATEVLSGDNYMGHGVSDGGKSAFWQLKTSGNRNVLRLEGSTACEDSFANGNVSALTYSGDVTDFELQFDTQLHGWHSQAMISIGVGKAGDWSETSDRVITLVTEYNNQSSHGYSGKFTLMGTPLADGNKTFSAPNTGWKTLKLKVYNKKLEIFVNGTSVGELQLNNYWQGGMVSFMSNNAYARYSNISLEELQAFDSVLCHNFGEGDRTLSIYSDTDTFGSLSVPLLEDYSFAGFYRDEALTDKAEDTDIVYGLSEIWAKWERILSANNTYDEADITYTSEETETVYSISRDILADGDQKLAEHAKLAGGAGEDGTNAVRFYQLRGSSEQDESVSYVRIYNTLDSEYGFFVPEAGAKYTVSLKYKIAACTEDVDFILREVGAYGSINCNDKQIVKLNSENTVKGEWATVSAQFIAGAETTAVYIALVSASGEGDANAEIYIDDIAVSLPETEAVYDYSTDLGDPEALKADGWTEAFSTDPQQGTAFSNVTMGTNFTFSEGFLDRRTDSNYNGSYQNGWNKPLRNVAALTYGGKEYKYFTLELDWRLSTRKSSGSPWPYITFGQPSTTPEVFYKNKIWSGYDNPVGGDSAIGVYTQFEGAITIAGKNVTEKNWSPTEDYAGDFGDWRHITITVTPGQVTVTESGNTVTTELKSNYDGGYISLMIANSPSAFKNLKITELDYSVKEIDYSNPLTDMNNLESEGWKAAYSADPQAGIEFADCATINEYIKSDLNGLQRNEKGFTWKGSDSYGYWKDPFYLMSALTYTGEQFKYFTLTVDYMVQTPGVPWPIVTFGQQSTTPEFFYCPVNDNSDPDGSDSVIAVYPETEGSINIMGTNVEAKRLNATKYTEKKQWHTLTIRVIPGKVTVTVDGGAVSLETTLSDNYQGGYIALMLGHSYSRFKNLSITEYEFFDASQETDVSEKVFDISEEQCSKSVIIKTETLKEQVLETLSAVSASGEPIKTEKLSSNVYIIKDPKPGRITVRYAPMKLDYDPEYTLKYYFDWEEELNDFTAARSPQLDKEYFTAVDVADRWRISDGILLKPVIDTSDTTTVNSSSDFNILMLKDYKFRNFELTVEYKHGRVGGFGCGIIFGLQDPMEFNRTEEGKGIWACVESDSRGGMFGYDIQNPSSEDGTQNFPWAINLEGYPQYDTEQIHTMRLIVLDGVAKMYIDDIEKPIVGYIPKDYYGHIALGVANNVGWYNNLTIQPLDIFGNPITLEENKAQAIFNPNDFEEDIWNGDNSEWGEQPIDYYDE